MSILNSINSRTIAQGPTVTSSMGMPAPAPVAPVPTGQPPLSGDFRSKWYQLADRSTALNQQKNMESVAKETNSGLVNGLGALGFRGNNNAGSMERLAGGAARGAAAGGLASGQSAYDQLAGLYSQGLQQIDIPTLQGQDMQSAMNAGKRNKFLGII